ncbi:peptidase C39 family protein [Leucobacter sp. W1478]|uniref:peptidase C39 family protein n=1 Tax=Leucobacter sp. W1478 TaxID=3439065 RepID=UPI003F3F5714
MTTPRVYEPAASALAVTAEPFTHLGPEGAHRLGPARTALWSADRALFAPEVFRARYANGELAAAALVTSRRGTSYRKIVDLWCAPVPGSGESAAADTRLFDDTAFAAVLDAIIAELPQGVLALKFEERPAVAPLWPEALAALAARGFVPDPLPVHSVESTLGGVRGFTRWEGRAPRSTIGYYGQTTDVTCGAVTALMALETEGARLLQPADHAHNRTIEIELWRTATNMPAIEPVGLAVATARAAAERRVPFSLPRVYLSVPSPVLLEWYEGDERQLRADLQAESARQADALGIEVVHEWIGVDEIATAISAGNFVFLLIDLTLMINDPTPHWVLAHDVIDGCVIIDDPWVEKDHGETWVDTHHLPVPFASVDEMTRWGEPAYRGVVVVPRVGSGAASAASSA